MISYRKRENYFEAGDDEWVVEGDVLIHKRADGTVARQRLADVREVRLRFAPTRSKTWRHVFELKFRTGHAWHIDNGHFAGIGSFEDRSASFVPFVREVIGLVAAHAPEARASLGIGWISYVLQVSMLVVLFSLLATVLLTLPIGDGIFGVVAFKLAMIAFFLPVLFRWVVKARPRTVRIDAIPESAFPRVDSSG